MIIESSYLVENPLVSVVIATYNQVSFIEETVMSALNQKCSFPFEVIVADDGSNDGERELLKSLQKKYSQQIRLILNDVNLRVTKNYVNAIYQARGKYIATLDGDDVWITTDKLEKQVDILEAEAEVSIVYTGYSRYDNEKKHVISTSIQWDAVCLRQKGKDSAAVFVNNDVNYPLGSSACFRKDIYIKGCIDYPELIEKDSAGEGTILNISMSMNGYFRFINENMVMYRILPQSLCHFSTPLEEMDFGFRCLDLLIKSAKALAISPTVLIQKTSRRFYLFSIKNQLMDEYNQKMGIANHNYSYFELKRAYFFFCNPISYWLAKIMSNCYRLCKRR